MAKKTSSKRTRTRTRRAKSITLPEAAPVAEEQHPDFQNGLVSEAGEDQTANLIPAPGQPFPQPPEPSPPLFPLPERPPFPEIPGPITFRFCGPVSGRYTLRSRPRFPIQPIGLLQVTVRVDVDRFYPQNRISIEVVRLFPRSRAHAIAEVTSDSCLGLFRRRVEAQITYRDGDNSLIPGDQVVFEANRTTGFSYSQYRLTLISARGVRRTHELRFRSRYFDPVEFEVDVVTDAGTPTTTYDTASHPNRPASLPAETISFETTYQRAGFDVSMSPNTSTIPVAGAGANTTWSDAEMHDAMVTFWSRFADRPQWALWVLFARRHDRGRGLGGIMFDDIGPNHRQGTAIFTDTFIQDAPPGDPNAAAWRQRMVYWTAIHEMGHAFNLAHAWQKSLGRPLVDGDPWIPLTDAPESRSFMNYPFRVSGGENAFFADFDFRFSDDELIFMRHAPRRFVQMGNEDWFENHAFEQDAAAPGQAYTLQVRPNRDVNRFRFMEPVSLELKLTNASQEAQSLDEDALSDGRHVAFVVRREGGTTRKWRPFMTHCHRGGPVALKPGESMYASHFVGASTDGWLIDEPGFYLVQAAVNAGGGVINSNVLRIFVSAPATDSENQLAPDYFSEDVARVLAFQGSPYLETANKTLEAVMKRCATNPAATHAAVALSSPMLRKFKVLKADKTRADLAFTAKPLDLDAGRSMQTEALIEKPTPAAQTLGHIRYFDTLERLAKTLADAGAGTEARAVQKKVVETMGKRMVLKSVVDAARRRLNRMK